MDAEANNYGITAYSLEDAKLHRFRSHITMLTTDVIIERIFMQLLVILAREITMV